MALLVLHGRNPYHYRFYMAGINIIMSQVVSNKITPWAILRNICEDHVRSWNQKWGWGPYNLGSQDWPCSLLILNCGPCSAMSWLTPCFSFHPKKENCERLFWCHAWNLTNKRYTAMACIWWYTAMACIWFTVFMTTWPVCHLHRRSTIKPHFQPCDLQPYVNTETNLSVNLMVRHDLSH